MNDQQPTIYTCPMHPEIERPTEGLCPECGMRLVPARKKGTAGVGQAGHGGHGAGPAMKHGTAHHAAEGSGRHQGHSTNVFRTKFWVSLALTIPVVAFADLFQGLLHYRIPDFPGSRLVPLALASVIFFYGGWVFLASAYRELRARLPGMMTLISLAISVAYLYSLWTTVSGGQTLFWELATLITIMLLGHWMEMRAVSGAQGALKELSKLLPDQAELIVGDGQTKVVPLTEIKVGDLVLVKPGAKVPTDGQVVEGNSEVNESMATGESRSVGKGQGSPVIAGTVNGDGALRVKVTQIGDKTFLAGVMRLVAEAQSSKSRLQLVSDRAAFFLTIVAVGVGGLTLAGWLLVGAGPAFAVERMVAVLVIACPHALGLAVPLVASISTTKAANSGLLVKRRLALEAARLVDTVLFDKTGTLTKGQFGVDAVVPAPGQVEDQVLRLAASVNRNSEHPLAKAMVEEAQKREMPLAEVRDFQRLAGQGARGLVDGQEVLVGNQSLADQRGMKADDRLRQGFDHLSGQGKTVVWVMADGRVVGAIALADIIRDESRQAVEALRLMGISTAMITGDSEEVAKWVAGQLGLDQYFAKVLPGDKAAKVKLLQAQGRRVAMVGDGVNDAPALTQADLGLAIGAGTNVAIESAGIILVRDDPRDIVKTIRLSKLTYRKMIQNLWWAAGYNIVAIPLAAGALAHWGIFLQPAVAALLMSLSTVIVAVNAMLLKRARLD